MADVFTNDLRIREQAVGANSNLWGGYLNTSLENIAEAFSYGTEALADSATQTLTLADGASDELRSFYVKLTGTLSQATTVTLAPNTISKVWMIENATSGGFDVTISQGSGANVVVGNGNVKMIATDGAGAGGVVYDLLTDLELAGNLTLAGAAAFNSYLTTTAVYGKDDANTGIQFDGSDVITLHTGGSERVRIDAAGSVGIKNSTPGSFNGAGNDLVVGAGTSGDNNGITIYSNSNSTGHLLFADGTSGSDGYTGYVGYNHPTNSMSFHTNNGLERVRITATGQVLVGRTTDDVDTIGGMIDSNGIVYSSINETTYNTFLFRAAQSANAYRFYVAGSGQVNSTFTSISSISDARLKENVRDYEAGGLAEILKLQPRVFDWKENEGKNIKNDVGFIAQEFEEVFPDWVSNFLHDDLADAKTVSASELIFPMVNAFKEISAEIESLKAEVAALKGA